MFAPAIGAFWVFCDMRAVFVDVARLGAVGAGLVCFEALVCGVAVSKEFVALSYLFKTGHTASVKTQVDIALDKCLIQSRVDITYPFGSWAIPWAPLEHGNDVLGVGKNVLVLGDYLLKDFCGV